MQGLDLGDEQNNLDFRQGPIHRHLQCHPERSEGSVAMGREMLRCAQHDMLSGLSAFFYFIMNV